MRGSVLKEPVVGRVRHCRASMRAVEARGDVAPVHVLLNCHRTSQHASKGARRAATTRHSERAPPNASSPQAAILTISTACSEADRLPRLGQDRSSLLRASATTTIPASQCSADIAAIMTVYPAGPAAPIRG